MLSLEHFNRFLRKIFFCDKLALCTHLQVSKNLSSSFKIPLIVLQAPEDGSMERIKST